MATKVIILGQEEPTKAKKPIEFVKSVNIGVETVSTSPACFEANDFNRVYLLQRNYMNGFDLMAANGYSVNPNNETVLLYLGHFNDGVVE